MPVVLEDIEIKLEFADMLRRAPLPRLAAPDGFISQHPRTAGVHMSGILHPLAIAAHKLKPGSIEDQEEINGGMYPLLWAMGVAWEEFCASLYPNMDYQPGETELDGIYMTCDGISYNAGLDEGMIEEMKFTHTSSDKPILDQWMKLVQGMSYCKGYGVRLVRWHYCCVRGNYKKFGPVYKRYLVRFSDAEVEKTWQMMVNNKSLAIAEVGQ